MKQFWIIWAAMMITAAYLFGQWVGATNANVKHFDYRDGLVVAIEFASLCALALIAIAAFHLGKHAK